jgi:hypothetical protein
MYHQFNIQQFYVLPTQCIYVFWVDLRTNSDYSLYSINCPVFITETGFTAPYGLGLDKQFRAAVTIYVHHQLYC